MERANTCWSFASWRILTNSLQEVRQAFYRSFLLQVLFANPTTGFGIFKVHFGQLTLSCLIMWFACIFSALLFAFCAAEKENCDVSKYVECMEPISNATFGHPHGLFQTSEDLIQSCPIIKNGIKCIEKYASECGTEMIAENYKEQFQRPAEFLNMICDTSLPVRTEYLKATPCLTEHSEDLEICSVKVQEFLAVFEADTNEKELTMTCMYEMMLRACLMSTGAEKCGMETASFIRKALIYSPSVGMQTCNKE